MEVIERVELDGRPFELETGKLAKQADGACLVRFGESFVLATACFEESTREGRDFLPLTVDYREYTYAGGRIPGGWFKREGRPTEKEILTSRLIDRPLRPLFPEGYFLETQVVASVLSADGTNDPDVLALNGAHPRPCCSRSARSTTRSAPCASPSSTVPCWSIRPTPSAPRPSSRSSSPAPRTRS